MSAYIGVKTSYMVLNVTRCRNTHIMNYTSHKEGYANAYNTMMYKFCYNTTPSQLKLHCFLTL